MSVFEPVATATELVPVGDWHPTRHTLTLSGTEDFTTDGDRLLTATAHWRTPEGPLVLDVWQRWLIRHVLETYPPDWPVIHLRGRLRFKQVVVSMARQNGKSVVGALLAFYFLTKHVRGARVGGFASRDEQALIIYNRVKFAIDQNPTLKAILTATATRGIKAKDGTAEYNTYPAKEDSVQGEPFSGALYDELHLGLPALWDAIVLGQRAKALAMLVGFTTAGDADSLLLKRLYAEGAAAIRGADERFGFFVWEALDLDLTEVNVIAASPAIACGRIPLADAMRDAENLWNAPPDEHGVTGRDRAIRYVLNRFLDGTADSWVSAEAFNTLSRPDLDIDRTVGTVYGIATTGRFSHATITATRIADGQHHTELVASLVAPDDRTLMRAARDLAARGTCRFAIPPGALKSLARRLKDAGYEVWHLSGVEMQAAITKAQAAIVQGTTTHDGSELLRRQSATAKARIDSNGMKFVRGESSGDLDAIEAAIAGIYVAEATEDEVNQLF